MATKNPCERACGCDCDDVCSYTTPRTVRIRDRRLGILHYAVLTAIFVQVVIRSVVVEQRYMKVGQIYGSVRVSLNEPLNRFRYRFGRPPYCTGANTTNNWDPRYRFPAPGLYQYVGDGAADPVAAQYDCQYLDANFLLPYGMEINTVFVPSRVTTYNQTLNTGIPGCTLALSTPNCTYTEIDNSTVFIPDVDMHTLTVDHSFASSVGVSGSSLNMDGVMLDTNGNVIDLCSVYYNYLGGSSEGCPPGIGIGAGSQDKFPIRALMLAAGISRLDDALGTSPPWDATTRRFAGTVLLIDIQYTNFAQPTAGSLLGTQTLNSGLVKYAYVVRAVPNIQAVSPSTDTPDGSIPALTRTVVDRHGVRIIISQTGAIGTFDFQTLLVNLTVALGLLSVAALLVDAVATKLLPLRALYAQYKERVTVDLSDVKDADDMATLKEFERDPNLVDPVPPILDRLLTAQRRRVEDRAKLLAATLPSTVSRSAASSGKPSARPSVVVTGKPANAIDALSIVLSAPAVRLETPRPTDSKDASDGNDAAVRNPLQSMHGTPSASSEPGVRVFSGHQRPSLASILHSPGGASVATVGGSTPSVVVHRRPTMASVVSVGSGVSFTPQPPPGPPPGPPPATAAALPGTPAAAAGAPTVVVRSGRVV